MMSHPPATIHAAYNLTIELEPGRWQLFNGVSDPASPDVQRALLDARPDGIVCAPTFARARRLPDEGRLSPSSVARVVVGWAPESRNWHLGLMLQPGSGDEDRLRWCGLAHWPSGPAVEHERQAAEAGRALAEVIRRPFHIVPPAHGAPATPPAPAIIAPPAPAPVEDVAEVTAVRAVIAPELNETSVAHRSPSTGPVAPGTPAEAPALPPASAAPADISLAPAPAIPLRTPPFAFEGWRIVAMRRGFVVQRPTRWVIALILRAGGYMIGALLFVMLGLGSLESSLAQVSPEWLPYVGIGVGAVLGLLALATWWRVLTVADVVIDTQRREVRRRNRFNGLVRWRVPFESVEYLVVTQTPARPHGRKRPDRPVTIGLDAWLHLYDGRRFWQLAELGPVEGKCHVWPLVERLQKQPGRRALVLAHYDTPAHHAALHLAGTLGAGVWVDVR